MFDIPVIRLGSGAGEPGKQACWMSALSVLVGAKWTDTLECVDYPINKLCIEINDALPTDESRSRLILPRLFDPIGTAGDPAATRRRTFYLVDRAVRLFAVDALISAGLPQHVPTLAALPEIVDEATAKAAIYAASAASHASSHAASYAAIYAASAASHAASAASHASSYAASHASSYAASAASYAASAASYAASHAASYAASHAASHASSHAASAASEQYIVEKVFPVLDRLIEMGPHAPKESITIACSRDEFLQQVGAN